LVVVKPERYRGLICDYLVTTSLHKKREFQTENCIVISVKILGLKSLRYIAEIKSVDNRKGRAVMTLPRISDFDI